MASDNGGNLGANISADKSFADPDWVKERQSLLAEFLDGGKFDLEGVLAVRELSNAVLAQGSATHTLWIKNKQRTADDTDESLRSEMSSRVAQKLAMLPFLNYDHATDEANVSVLMLSMVQAGFVPIDNLDGIYEFFANKAPLPMLSREDLPLKGRERKFRVSGYVLPPLPPSWLRATGASYNAEDTTFRAKVDGISVGFKSLSADEQVKLLNELGVPLGGSGNGSQPHQGPSYAVGDLGSQIAQGMAPMLARLEDSFMAMTESAKRRHKDSGSESDEVPGSEDRVEKLCMMGGVQMAKKKRMEIKDFYRENEVEKIRSAQRIRRREGNDKWALLWNQALEEQTALLVQLERLEHEKVAPKITHSSLTLIASYERTIHVQLMALREKLEVLEGCCAYMKVGGTGEAEELHRLYTQKLSGSADSSLMVKLRAEVKTELKYKREMGMLAAVEKMGAGKGQHHQQTQHHKTQQLQQPGSDDKGKGKGKGKAGHTTQDFAMKWVDGSHFDQSLAGVKAPSPDKFPGFYMARLDSSTKGIIHTAGWPGSCGACGEVGHSHSECPARRWSVGGTEYVNVRWLWEKGMCDAQGSKK